jgi:hypothetical protein
MVASDTRYIVMNLEGTQISPDPGIKKSTEVLHVDGQRYVRAQHIHGGLEVPYKAFR